MDIAIAIVYGYSYTHNDIDKWCASVFVLHIRINMAYHHTFPW